MADLVFALVNEQTGQQMVAIMLVVVIVLLGGGSLWLAWLMRGKRRQAEALRIERQTLLESQFAALQQMRETGQHRPARATNGSESAEIRFPQAGLAEGPPEDTSQQTPPEG